MRKHYLVYQITNILTGERYIGQHQTYDPNDGYMGSGKLITEKIEELGIQNFNKKIIKDCSSFEEMNQLEIDLINALEPEYNLNEGGSSFYYINSNKLHHSEEQNKERVERWSEGGRKAFKKKFNEDKDFRERVVSHLRDAYKIAQQKYPEGVFKGKKHSAKTRKKISESKRGKQTTSTLGKHWFTDGKNSILSYECPEGFYRGRVM